jgi:DNA-binding beta-propeller fold protein YncE
VARNAGGRTRDGGRRNLRAVRFIIVAALAGLSVSAATPASAGAAGVHVSGLRFVAHFDFSLGQTPENIALEPDGSADVTFSEAAQVAQVSPDGHVRLLAQLPDPARASCPISAGASGVHAITSGIVRDSSGTVYTALCAATPDLQGIWRLDPSGPVRVAALPAAGFPNGIALDKRHGFIYVTDSVLSTVWRVSLADGSVIAWAVDTQLAPDGFFGANGLKLHDGAVWVTNTKLGTLLRIPIEPDGTAGQIQTVATGLPGIDDLAFTGSGPCAWALAVISPSSQVVLIRPDGSEQVVLTAADGLSNPSAVAIRGDTFYVTSAAYFTGINPSLLRARLDLGDQMEC